VSIALLIDLWGNIAARLIVGAITTDLEGCWHSEFFSLEDPFTATSVDAERLFSCSRLVLEIVLRYCFGPSDPFTRLGGPK
jgi:hypothetical protein